MADIYANPNEPVQLNTGDWGNSPSTRSITGNADVDKYLLSLPEDQRQAALDKINAPLTGEDVGELMKNPEWNPTHSEYQKWLEWHKKQESHIWEGIAAGFGSIMHEFGDAAGKFIQHPIDTGKKLPASLGEAMFQGGRNFYGMLAQSQDPESILFKFKNAIAGDGTVDGYNQFLKARAFNKQSADLASGKTTLVADKDMIDHEVTQALSYIADPSMLIPFGKIASGGMKLVGLGEGLAMASMRAGAIKEGLLGGALKWGVGAPIELMGGAVRNTIDYGTAKAGALFEATTGVPINEYRASAKLLGLGSSIAGASGHSIPYLSTISNTYIAGTAAHGVGEALSAVGTQIQKQAEFGRGILSYAGQALEDTKRAGIVLSPHAERLLKVIDAVDPLFGYAADVAGGAAHGAMVGGTLGYLNAGQEGLGHGIGAGVALGGVGGLVGRGVADVTGNTLKQRVDVQFHMLSEGLKQLGKTEKAFIFEGLVKAAIDSNGRIDPHRVKGIMVAIDKIAPDLQVHAFSTDQFRMFLEKGGYDIHTGKFAELSRIRNDEFNALSREERANVLAILRDNGANFAGKPDEFLAQVDKGHPQIKRNWNKLSDLGKKQVLSAIESHGEAISSGKWAPSDIKDVYSHQAFAERATSHVNDIHATGDTQTAKDKIKEFLDANEGTLRGDILKDKLRAEGYLDKNGNLLETKGSGYADATHGEFSRMNGFVVRREDDGRVHLYLNTDNMGNTTFPHEMFHAIFKTTVMKPEFMDRWVKTLLGYSNSNGTVISKGAVPIYQLKDFFQKYINNTYRGAEREGKLNDLAQALDEYQKRGTRQTISDKTQTTLEHFAEEFGAYYFSHWLNSKPIDYLFRGGELNGLRGILESTKNSWLDYWQAKIQGSNPNFDFSKGLDVAFGNGRGSRKRVSSLDYFMQDFVRAVANTNREGLDITKLSAEGLKTLSDANGVRGIVVIDKNGRPKVMSEAEAKAANRAAGKQAFNIISQLDPALRKNGLQIDGDGNLSGRFNVHELDALVRAGIVSRVWADKVLKGYEILDGNGSNVIGFGYLGATEHIGDFAWPRTKDTTFKQRRAILLDVETKIGADGTFHTLFHTLDKNVIEGRGNNIWKDPVVRDLWDGDRGSMEQDFFRYMANLAKHNGDNSRVPSAKLLDRGDGKGWQRRNALHQMLGIALTDGDVYLNKPIAEIPQGIRHSVTSFNIDRATPIRVETGEKYEFNNRNAIRDAGRNFMPSNMESEETPNGRILKHASGYRIVEENNKFKVYDDKNNYIALTDNKENAAKLAFKDFMSKIPAGDESAIEGFNVVHDSETNFLPYGMRLNDYVEHFYRQTLDNSNKDSIFKNFLQSRDDDIGSYGFKELFSSKKSMDAYEKLVDESLDDSVQADLNRDNLKESISEKRLNGETVSKEELDKLQELIEKAEKAEKRWERMKNEFKDAEDEYKRIFQETEEIYDQSILGQESGIYSSRYIRDTIDAMEELEKLQQKEDSGTPVNWDKDFFEPFKLKEQIYQDARRMWAEKLPQLFKSELFSREGTAKNPEFKGAIIDILRAEGKVDEKGHPLKIKRTEFKNGDSETVATIPSINPQRLINLLEKKSGGGLRILTEAREIGFLDWLNSINKNSKVSVEDVINELSRRRLEVNIDRAENQPADFGDTSGHVSAGQHSDYRVFVLRMNHSHGVDGHFGSDVVVHVRTTVRLDSNGRRVLHVEEIQANNSMSDIISDNEKKAYKQLLDEASAYRRKNQFIRASDKVIHDRSVDDLANALPKDGNKPKIINEFLHAISEIHAHLFQDEKFPQFGIKASSVSELPTFNEILKDPQNGLLRKFIETYPQYAHFAETYLDRQYQGARYMEDSTKALNAVVPDRVSRVLRRKGRTILKDYEIEQIHSEMSTAMNKVPTDAPLQQMNDWIRVAVRTVMRKSLELGCDRVTITPYDKTPMQVGMDEPAAKNLYGNTIPNAFASELKKYGIKLNIANDFSKDSLLVKAQERQKELNTNLNKEINGIHQLITDNNEPIGSLREIFEFLHMNESDALEKYNAHVYSSTNPTYLKKLHRQLESSGVSSQLETQVWKALEAKRYQLSNYNDIQKHISGETQPSGALALHKYLPNNVGDSQLLVDGSIGFDLNNSLKKDLATKSFRNFQPTENSNGGEQPLLLRLTGKMREIAFGKQSVGRTYDQDSRQWKHEFLGKFAEENPDIVKGLKPFFLQKKDGSVKLDLTDNTGESAHVGHIQAVIDNTGKIATLSSHIQKEYRGKRLSYVLYSEMAERLRAMGIERVNGTIINEQGIPVKVREEIIGNTRLQSDDRRISHTQAAKAIAMDKMYKERMYPDSQGNYGEVKVYNDLKPNARYQVHEDIPAEKGTSPIKLGYTRMYHQTNPENIESIKKNGLLVSKTRPTSESRGVSVSDTPFYGDNPNLATIELQVPNEILKQANGSALQTDVPASDIIAAHENWHDRARYILKNKETLKEVLDGGMDYMLGDGSPEAKAIEHIKKKYGKSFSANEHGGRTYTDEQFDKHFIGRFAEEHPEIANKFLIRIKGADESGMEDYDYKMLIYDKDTKKLVARTKWQVMENDEGGLEDAAADVEILNPAYKGMKLSHLMQSERLERSRFLGAEKVRSQITNQEGIPIKNYAKTIGEQNGEITSALSDRRDENGNQGYLPATMENFQKEMEVSKAHDDGIWKPTVYYRAKLNPKAHYQPKESWISESTSGGQILKSTSGFVITQMNKKFRLYNVNKAVLGIYDNIEEAKRKAEKSSKQQ